MTPGSINVYPCPDYPAAVVVYNGQRYPAVVGKGGVTQASEKREGDSKTPLGEYKILGGYYRPDALTEPSTKIKLEPLSADDVWVDESSNPLYNMPSKASAVAGASHEELWRPDHLYNIILDLSYNRQPPVAGKGSAIFVHVARDQNAPSNTPTAGCIALSQKHLLELLAGITPETLVIIHEKTQD